MTCQDLILWGLLIGCAFGFPQRQERNIDDQIDPAIAPILETMKNFNVTDFFASMRFPPCVEECFERLGNALPTPRLDESWSMEKAKTVCVKFETMKNCMAEKPHCGNVIVDVGLHALEYLCNDDASSKGLIPCLRRETLKIHAICERSCKMGATLMDAISYDTKRTDVMNFRDQDGNKILSVPDLHTLCNTSTCFLSCMKTGLDEKCPNGGSAFIDNIVNSLLKRVTSNSLLPETKVTDAYASLISSFLPKQCQYLILQDKDIILTTPGTPFTFVTEPHDQILMTTAASVQAPAGGSVVSEEASSNVVNTRNEEGENKSKSGKANSGSSNAAHLFLLTAVLLPMIMQH